MSQCLTLDLIKPWVNTLSSDNKTEREVERKRAGLSFLIVNMGVPWALRPNSPVLLRSCPKCVVVSSLEEDCHNSPKLFTRNPVVCFLEVDKACEDVFIILPRFLKILLESEMWSAMLRPGRKPHWLSFSFDSIISQHRFSRHLARCMLIIWKFPKSIADRTKGPREPHAVRGPRVWDPWSRRLHFRSFQSKLWSFASAKFRKF